MITIAPRNRSSSILASPRREKCPSGHFSRAIASVNPNYEAKTQIWIFLPFSQTSFSWEKENMYNKHSMPSILFICECISFNSRIMAHNDLWIQRLSSHQFSKSWLVSDKRNDFQCRYYIFHIFVERYHLKSTKSAHWNHYSFKLSFCQIGKWGRISSTQERFMARYIWDVIKKMGA